VTRWQAVVFDLDDTLYPEQSYVLSGFRAVARWAEVALGIPAATAYRELETLFLSGVRGTTFDRWLQSHDLDYSLVPTLVSVYRDHRPALAPFPGVPELLARLGQRYRLGLVSDGYLAVQRRKLAALGIESNLDAVVFSDENGRESWKPAPWPFQEVLRRLETEACHTVYVADNVVKDFYGARQVGLATIHVRRQEGEYANLEPPTPMYAADEAISDLGQLEAALARLEPQ
jgi:putative hydrolase of the HAD superfamily